MSFFQGFNTVRVLILLFLIGSIPMGMQVWKREQGIRTLAAQVGHHRNFEARSVQGSELVARVDSIITLAKEHSELQKSLKGEGIRGNDSPMVYVRTIAKDSKINLGRVEINASEKDYGGFIDKIFSITPQDSKTTFTRQAISNFMYKLESDSRRVRVTKFNIDATDENGRRPKIDVLPSDLWSFDCEISIREQKAARGR
tara:strand:+ start:6206 stop:6805 length:600 start_codon:yes stop_codon:yes gene_type:complete